MSNNFKCSACGAPNDSNHQCQYCGELFDNVVLVRSTIDKNKFDLAIHEMNKREYDKSLKIIDTLLEKDNNNRLAWFYKLCCELVNDSDLDNFIELVNKKDLIKICNAQSNLLIQILNYILVIDYNDYSGITPNYYIPFKFFDTNLFLNFINKFSFESQSKLFKILIGRYSHKNTKSTLDIVNMFAEIEDLIHSKSFLKFEKEETLKLLESIFVLLIDNINEEFNQIKEFEVELTKRNSKINTPNFALSRFEFQNKQLFFNENFNKVTNVVKINFTDYSIFSNYISDYNNITQEIRKYSLICQSRENNTSDSRSKSSCFIATATMGSYDHPVVVDLRHFRDNWLLSKDWGISFVNCYYKNGPHAAKLIEKSYIIRKITYLLIVKPLHRITKLFFK